MCEQDADGWLPERFVPVLSALADLANLDVTVPYFEMRSASTEFLLDHQGPGHQVIVIDEYGVPHNPSTAP